MKTLEILVIELEEENNKLRKLLEAAHEYNMKLSLLATDYQYDDILRRLALIDNYEIEIETLYGIVTSRMKDEINYSMLKQWVHEERAKIKQQKEF